MVGRVTPLAVMRKTVTRTTVGLERIMRRKHQLMLTLVLRKEERQQQHQLMSALFAMTLLSVQSC